MSITPKISQLVSESTSKSIMQFSKCQSVDQQLQKTSQLVNQLARQAMDEIDLNIKMLCELQTIV